MYESHEFIHDSFKHVYASIIENNEEIYLKMLLYRIIYSIKKMTNLHIYEKIVNLTSETAEIEFLFQMNQFLLLI